MTLTSRAPDDGEKTEPPAADGVSLPELPAVAREQTEAGAQAFVEHYFEVLNRMAAQP
ncbi:hypothetical protein [Ornithinimicrobium sp. W1665]|uniref:hypothetical protein n=1 Tax=Ornithinimicrobium sp. W1665 TaxID=3416666 RepID=UPI003CE8509E